MSEAKLARPGPGTEEVGVFCGLPAAIEPSGHCLGATRTGVHPQDTSPRLHRINDSRPFCPLPFCPLCALQMPPAFIASVALNSIMTRPLAGTYGNSLMIRSNSWLV